MGKQLKKQMDQFVHPAPKAGWICILLAVLNWCVPGGSICVNAYQAEGGIHWPTLGLGWACQFLSVLTWEFGWILLYLPLILVLCLWGFAIYHGYLVMQKSK